MYRFICRGWKCAKYIDDCVRSLQKQTITDWKAYLIVDDSTVEERVKLAAVEAADSRFVGVPISGRMGVCMNLYCGIGGILDAQDEDTICILDLDDKLLTEKSLEIVDNNYRKYPNMLCTYGSFVVSSTGRIHKLCKSYPTDAKVRKHRWRGSHLKTFKYKIFRHIPQDYLKHNDEWGKAASDLALMFCVMEIAGMENCRFIKDPIYWYRYPTGITCNRGTQRKYEEIWRKKNPLVRAF